MHASAQSTRLTLSHWQGLMLTTKPFYLASCRLGCMPCTCSAPGALQCSLLAVYCPASLCHCREAFNNMSAYALLHGDPLTEHMKSVAASNSMAAAEAVAALGRAMGLEVRRCSAAVRAARGGSYWLAVVQAVTATCCLRSRDLQVARTWCALFQ